VWRGKTASSGGNSRGHDMETATVGDRRTPESTLDPLIWDLDKIWVFSLKCNRSMWINSSCFGPKSMVRNCG
jgi:hypothetical protein